MEDERTVEDISKQINAINRNNFSSMKNVTSMEMLLTSNNNGTSKDAEMSQRLNNLKNKIQQAAEATSEIKSMLGKS